MTERQGTVVIVCLSILAFVVVVWFLAAVAVGLSDPKIEQVNLRLQDGREIPCVYTALSGASLECDWELGRR